MPRCFRDIIFSKEWRWAGCRANSELYNQKLVVVVVRRGLVVAVVVVEHTSGRGEQQE